MEEQVTGGNTAVTPEAPGAEAVITDAQIQHAVEAEHGIKAAVKHPSLGTVETAAADLAAVGADAPTIVEETRRGYLTTEFWATVFTLLADLGLDISTQEKAIITGLVGVYALARGIAKKGVPNITPVLP